MPPAGRRLSKTVVDEEVLVLVEPLDLFDVLVVCLEDAAALLLASDVAAAEDADDAAAEEAEEAAADSVADSVAVEEMMVLWAVEVAALKDWSASDLTMWNPKSCTTTRLRPPEQAGYIESFAVGP